MVAYIYTRCVTNKADCGHPLGAAAQQSVLAVNLANQHGSEGVLGSAFSEQAERFAKVKPGFEVVSFDFHKECGATRYDRRALYINTP